MNMPGKFVAQSEFRQLARQGQSRSVGVAAIVGKLADGQDGYTQSRVRRFIFSDGTVDRMGDRIDPNGWSTASFMQNPVALWAHDATQPPIGRCTGVWSNGAQLVGDIEFMPAETYAFADTIFRMVEGKWLNAVSVGFLPIDWEWADKDTSRPAWAIDYKRQELLEISICPIPANPNALEEARGLGINTLPLAKWADGTMRRGNPLMTGAQLKSFSAAAAARTRRAPEDVAILERGRAICRRFKAEIPGRRPPVLTDEQVLERARKLAAEHRKRYHARDPRYVAVDAAYRLARALSR